MQVLVAGVAYLLAVAILRESDPRVGCLALPLAFVAGLVVVMLLSAAIGLSAGGSALVGLAGGGIGVAVALAILARGRP
jgi:hypothetical protein